MSIKTIIKWVVIFVIAVNALNLLGLILEYHLLFGILLVVGLIYGYKWLKHHKIDVNVKNR